jgi:deoxyribonuclease (pyrimidine dimer)
LQGEYKEATRIFGIARKAQYEFLRGKYPIPKEYTLGTGHCKFFINKLGFIATRYEQLTQEMQRRGYKPNAIPRSDLLAGINPKLYNDYVPTPEAIEINKERIELRLKGE